MSVGPTALWILSPGCLDSPKFHFFFCLSCPVRFPFLLASLPSSSNPLPVLAYGILICSPWSMNQQIHRWRGRYRRWAYFSAVPCLQKSCSSILNAAVAVCHLWADLSASYLDFLFVLGSFTALFPATPSWLEAEVLRRDFSTAGGISDEVQKQSWYRQVIGQLHKTIYKRFMWSKNHKSNKERRNGENWVGNRNSSKWMEKLVLPNGTCKEQEITPEKWSIIHIEGPWTTRQRLGFSPIIRSNQRSLTKTGISGYSSFSRETHWALHHQNWDGRGWKNLGKSGG